MTTIKNNSSVAKDFFLYLFSFSLLYYSSISLITLLWQYINYFFPSVNYQNYSNEVFSGPMRFAIASLVILLPIYLLTIRFLSRDLDKNPEKKNLGIRRWLIYITLFLTAITIIIDLITILNQFLSGDFAIQFGLKGLAVLFVAGAVFWAMYLTLKRKPGEASPARTSITWILSIIIVVAVVGAFFIVGSPSTNRERAYDQTRIYDLQSLQWEVINYYQQKNSLPQSLEDLNDSLRNYDIAVDPKTGESYQYQLIDQGSLQFQLCANFATAVSNDSQRIGKPMVPPVQGSRLSENWSHPAGNYCFERTIDSDFYPQIKRIPQIIGA